MPIHTFKGTQKWTGNLGTGTSSYEAYSRNFEVTTPGKLGILGSADPLFRGEVERINPEDFLLNALSSCHMLWYFHLCADNGITVLNYSDEFEGVMEFGDGMKGGFTSVTLHPLVEIAEKHLIGKAMELHHLAHQKCFIANSVNFPVHCNAIIN